MARRYTAHRAAGGAAGGAAGWAAATCYNRAMAGAPAWYRDPKNRTRLRRWDGSAWTSDTRPLPGWAVPGAAAASARAAGRLRHRATLLWAASVGCAVTALALIPLVARPDAPRVPRISNRAFVLRANEVCARARVSEPEVREARSGAPDSARIDELVTRVDAMVGELRDLEVDPNDRPAVQRWLDDWGRYLAAGERLAVALRRGDDAAARQADADSEVPKQVLDRFSATNGLTQCVL